MSDTTRSVALSRATWAKLAEYAQVQSEEAGRFVSVSDVVEAMIAKWLPDSPSADTDELIVLWRDLFGYETLRTSEAAARITARACPDAIRLAEWIERRGLERLSPVWLGRFLRRYAGTLATDSAGQVLRMRSGSTSAGSTWWVTKVVQVAHPSPIDRLTQLAADTAAPESAATEAA